MKKFSGYLRECKLDILISVIYTIPILLLLGLLLAAPAKNLDAADFFSRAASIFLVIYLMLAPLLVFILVFFALRCLLSGRGVIRLIFSVILLLLYTLVFFWFLRLFDIRDVALYYSRSEVSVDQGLKVGLMVSIIALFYVLLAPLLIRFFGKVIAK